MYLKIHLHIVSFIKENKVFTLGMLLLAILLLKNPLSPNNIISNLEPSPDSIHYLNPLVSLLQGKGLVLSYQNRSIPAQVPPLYSLVLLPLYLIFREIRFFYVTNVLLTIISAILFYKIITKLITDKILKSILFLAFATNYIIYWYPSVAMAENLLIPLYLLSIWLLLQPVTFTVALLISFLVMAFFATKYIAWILSLSLTALFIVKLFAVKTAPRRKYLFLSLFFLNLLILFSVFAYAEYLNKGVNIFNVIRNNLHQLVAVFLSFFTKPQVEAIHQTAKATVTYSKFYMADSFIRYLAGIMGGPVTVVGVDFIILPIIVGMTSIPAIFTNLFTGKNRLLSFYLFISIVGTLYFISTFRTVDARYLFALIPAFFLIFGLFLDTLCKLLVNRNRKIYVYLLLGFVYAAISLDVFPLVIKQLKINFFRPDVAMNYEAIMTMNAYTNKLTEVPKPVIISVLSPFMIDFYSNRKYEVLPLSRGQYFTDNLEKVWGINPKNSLNGIYGDYLADGRLVLISLYDTDDDIWVIFDMKKIKEKFNLLLAIQGCNDKCNLYKLEHK